MIFNTPRPDTYQKAGFKRGGRPTLEDYKVRAGLGTTYEPTETAARRVRALAMLGVSAGMIAQDLGIGVPTLKKHYQKELDRGNLEAFAQVSGRLFKKAMDGDVVAMIFWMKARNGWRDRPEQINHNHIHSLSHEDRLRMLEADPTAQGEGDAAQDDPGGDFGDLGEVRPRFTEKGAPIIDADDAGASPEIVEDVSQIVGTKKGHRQKVQEVYPEGYGQPRRPKFRPGGRAGKVADRSEALAESKPKPKAERPRRRGIGT